MWHQAIGVSKKNEKKNQKKCVIHLFRKYQKHQLHKESLISEDYAVTCNVYVLTGEIILKQNLKSFSSASILIVEVLRSIL
jgi:serine protease inhibitor ecotin